MHFFPNSFYEMAFRYFNYFFFVLQNEGAFLACNSEAYYAVSERCLTAQYASLLTPYANIAYMDSSNIANFFCSNKRCNCSRISGFYLGTVAPEP